MDFWPEFLAPSWGREFIAGGFGGIAGIISGYPLDTLRIRQQHSKTGSAFSILRHVVGKEGPAGLYRGMTAPLASVTFQNLSNSVEKYSRPASNSHTIAESTMAEHHSREAHDSIFSTCKAAIGLVEGNVGLFLALGSQKKICTVAGEFGEWRVNPEWISGQNFLHPVGEENSLQEALGGIAGIISGYPLNTLRIRQQHSNTGSAFSILRHVVGKEGPAGLYRGMAAPLASVTFQNAMVFQIYAVLSRAFDSSVSADAPPSYKGVALGGIGTGALQSLMLSPVELVKIRLQLQNEGQLTEFQKGPVRVAKNIWKKEGLRGMYRGLGITVLRDAPSHGFYFWTYEYMREQLHPGCRESSQESLNTMLLAGGLAGVASWICCYPLDVIKTRLQAQSPSSLKYKGILDCLRKSIKEEGHAVLWRGLGTAVTRAFVVNGAIFSAYEIALRCLFNNENIQMEETI